MEWDGREGFISLFASHPMVSPPKILYVTMQRSENSEICSIILSVLGSSLCRQLAPHPLVGSVMECADSAMYTTDRLAHAASGSPRS